MSEQQQLDVIIVGAGVAGLTCGVVLAEAGKRIAILESTDRVGGRVKSDHVDGFTLDHGFQVLLTAYPTCKQFLDYKALNLQRFEPGALIRHQGRFTALADPWRNPSRALATLFSPVGSLGDKLRINQLRRQSRAGSLDDLYARPDVPTLQRLEEIGFSSRMIDSFFRPFLGGVFLDDSLSVSSRMLEFVFRMFSEGDVAIPADGMAAIPRQLAERLPRGAIRLQSTATKVDAHQVTLTDGSRLGASEIVIAAESSGAARLLNLQDLATDWNETTTIYFAADSRPDARRMLMLCGDETGPVQTATVLSNVAPSYAPAHQSLISASLGRRDDSVDLDDDEHVDSAVRAQLSGWFGDEVRNWNRLMTYRIPYGVPNRSLEPVQRSALAADWGGPKNVYLCGDYCETPSLHGAMNSGRRVAETVLKRD